MSTQDTAALQTAATDDRIELTDGGETVESAYTYHTEPASQGGERYVRCEHCGAECVPADPDRLTHREGCPLGGNR